MEEIFHNLSCFEYGTAQGLGKFRVIEDMGWCRIPRSFLQLHMQAPASLHTAPLWHPVPSLKPVLFSGHSCSSRLEAFLHGSTCSKLLRTRACFNVPRAFLSGGRVKIHPHGGSLSFSTLESLEASVKPPNIGSRRNGLQLLSQNHQSMEHLEKVCRHLLQELEKYLMSCPFMCRAYVIGPKQPQRK